MPASLPSRYHEVLYWRITEQRHRLVILNLLSIPLTIVAGLALTWIATQIGGLLALKRLEPTAGELVILIIAIALTLLLHELAHGLTMQAFGARPQYGILPQALAFYATAPGYAFTRNQYLLVTLAPLISLSLLSIIGMALFSASNVVVLLIVCATLNASGASGDVWMAALVARYPRAAYVIDERDGMRICLAE